MKKVLIIYPHFPPSNLAGVHRPRLFAQHLPSFGWEPIILTVAEKFYEEAPDYNLVKLLPARLRIEKVAAMPVTKPRLVGDIGLRGFLPLYKKAKAIIKAEVIDFIYIPIPSFYGALLGRRLHATTGVPYGIDYIDPWVHVFPGSNKVLSRHWLSTQLAKFLEPIAVKKASLITGVAAGYYKPVLERNPHLKTQAVVGAMPYGGEKADHAIVPSLSITPYLFTAEQGIFKMMYAGAMLPKAYEPLEAIFKAISANKAAFSNVQFHFVGTGSRALDDQSYTIKPLAEKYGLYNSIVFEYPKRIPYLDVLVHLNIANGIFILGSTEPHYTPSKTYQAVLSEKPLFAVLHQQSTAVAIVRQSNAGVVLAFDGAAGVGTITADFITHFMAYQQFASTYNIAQVDMQLFEQYSAKNVTAALANLLDKVVPTAQPSSTQH
ncbi:hypothetical protein ACFOWM_00180 [Ferruginibacter yonginensis]|uniref:Glycosyltransferase subfamily 4-like N-terminal domain-containing protein n=1 Tax=Ferruginibacter yonginensis TaxID=1310416 RepID=A0ABV8QNJ0_9BACT